VARLPTAVVRRRDAGAFAQVIEFEISHLAQAVWQPVGGSTSDWNDMPWTSANKRPASAAESIVDLIRPSATSAVMRRAMRWIAVVDRAAQILVSPLSDRHALVNEARPSTRRGTRRQW
jgi:hypothetical protein